VTVTDDGLHIAPSSGLHGGRVRTHHDHRLAMAFGVLAAFVPDVEVLDPDVVTKSWPTFWSMRRDLIGRS
jgi:3-phosphoshikimate 1-carboxyvinyltransferase